MEPLRVTDHRNRQGRRVLPHALALLALAALLAGADAQSSNTLLLVEEGRPRAKIVIGQGASAQAQSAAAEMQTYLQRITGAELRIVEERTRGAAILVGQAAARSVQSSLGLEVPSGLTRDFDDEGYVIATVDQNLVLAGNETEPYEGTWYAVYDFLHSLGCRWYFPGEFGEVVPTMATLRVDPVRRLVRPDLRVRDTWYSGHLAQTGSQPADFNTWKRRNRMSKRHLWDHCANPEAKFLQNPVDDSTYRLLPKEKYWDDHPEYFAVLPGGNRNDRFLCMNSPGALQAATDTVLEQFRTRPDHHDFAFSPPDAPVLCHCPECTQAMHGGYGGEGRGDVSDAWFGFVFRLADAVGREMPDKYITTMAYYNRCRPPEGVEGRRSNVLLQLASIQQCTVHSYADPDCWSRQEFAAMLKRWQELTGGQVFYEYDPHDWSHSQRPAWRSQGIADDLRFLKQGGGWGFSNEGQMAWMATGLNYYVRSRLAWDLQQNPQAMITDFCARFFGSAAKPMRSYYNAVEAAIRNCPTHVFAFSKHARDDVPVLFPQALRKRCGRWLREAARLAPQEPFASRVRAFRLHFDRINALAEAHDCALAGDYAGGSEWADKAGRTVADTGDTMLLQDAGPWGGVCSGKGVGDFMRGVLPWTDNTKGRLITALPVRALFRTDPASQGVVHRWYLPTEPRKGWRSILVSTAWHHQGVVTAEGRPYEGVGWYRFSMNWKGGTGERVSLFAPDRRGAALWVWVNGHFAGYLPADAQSPVIDLAAEFASGPNELVVRADGAGGLALPPFLFRPTGKRLTEVSVFPGQWLFRTDPQEQGLAENWHRPGLDESAWQAIPVPAAWEQTAVGPYDGYAWYRVRFTPPAELSGRELALRFGAVDEQAWVYLNGELVGEHTTASTGRTVHQIWDEAFDIPATNLRPGEENMLAVRVHDSLMAGGIHRPVRLLAASPPE